MVRTDLLKSIHEYMASEIELGGGHIDGIYMCPHDYADDCRCRKPKAGMLFEAAAEFELDLKNCWMVGDCASDVEAGRTAGCRTILVAGYHPAANFEAESLPEAVDVILKNEQFAG
nr:D-glycero-beta-D-manno-heptose-1,7-bisphosphate 7-phosphatase [uncultured bacterium]